MASRDETLMHPELLKRWHWLRDEFRKKYPNAPEPRLSCTYRSNAEQEQEYARGMSKARAGQSLHNYTPCYAFDVFFNDDKDTPLDKSDDVADYDFINFQRFGEMAKSIGLEWGGDWKGLVDGPHIQMPMTWLDAQNRKVPLLPALPYEVWKVKVYGELSPKTSIVQRIDFDNRTIHIRAE
jgi:hypothetical protein